MEKLIILDYENSSMHVYDVAPGTQVDEAYIDNLGYHLSGVSWMFGKDISIHFHKRTLQ